MQADYSLKDLIALSILSIPFVILGLYILSRINLQLYRIVDQSYGSGVEKIPYFVLEYLSPVGWQETVAYWIPGDGWTYTVHGPYTFKSMRDAKAFCKKHKKRLW